MLRHPPLTAPPGAADPATRLVIAGCSARKTDTARPLVALELYNGGCVPPLRARLGGRPDLRTRVRFLSAQHGLVSADTPLRSYDRPLDPARAAQLRPQVWEQLHAELLPAGMLTDVLVIAEPLYLVLVADLLAAPERPGVHWIPDPPTAGHRPPPSSTAGGGDHDPVPGRRRRRAGQ